MQDKQKKFGISHIFGRTLAMTVFFFLVGCVAGNSRENGLEELTLSEEEQSNEEQSGKKQEDKASDGKIPQDDSREETGDTTVFVYVCGAVEAPGVYELKADARVFEAIRAAGGVTAEAASDMVNQAEVVTDGEQIYVPTAGEAQGLGVGETGAKGTDNGKVNINTASEEELMTLTGIGEAKAAAILKYREEHGRFESIEELMEIEGIKEGVFGKIKDDITI